MYYFYIKFTTIFYFSFLLCRNIFSIPQRSSLEKEKKKVIKSRFTKIIFLFPYFFHETNTTLSSPLLEKPRIKKEKKKAKQIVIGEINSKFM